MGIDNKIYWEFMIDRPNFSEWLIGEVERLEQTLGVYEDKKKKEPKYGDDPLGYYHEHYEGLTRGQLNKKDNNLYFALRNRGLLEHIPLKKDENSYEKKKLKYDGDPLKYYHEHYGGLTRGELIKENFCLYNCLLDDDLLEHIPKK